MAQDGVFESEEGDTRKALMRATFRALQEHGYADLSIANIGDEFEKSTSLLYYHYESKDDLLLDFLKSMIERFESRGPRGDDHTPREAIEGLLDRFLGAPSDERRQAFTSAMVQLRAQAPHEAAYREQFDRLDRLMHDRLSALVREGIEDGQFREVDPDRTAALLQTTFHGAMFQRATGDPAGEERIDAARAALDDVLEETLYE